MYESKGYYYQTDELGRIKVAQGDLRLEDGKRNNRDQLKAGGDDRLPGDEGGHLIAKIFGGSGELDNLVAMEKIVNRSDYRIMENQWKSLLQEGKEVNVTIDIVYDGANKRPEKFNVKFVIDKQEATESFLNGGS